MSDDVWSRVWSGVRCLVLVEVRVVVARLGRHEILSGGMSCCEGIDDKSGIDSTTRLRDPGRGGTDRPHRAHNRLHIAREYETTAGAHGLPVVRFGKQLRVPRYRLEDWLGGPITWPIADHDTPVASPVASPDTSITPVASAARVTRRATRPSGQNTLPFSA